MSLINLIYRLGALETKLGVDAKYVPASQYESGWDGLENLEKGQIGLIGFLMNGLVDELRDKPEGEFEDLLRKFVIGYAEKLKSLDPSIKMYVILPFQRPKVEWTTVHLAKIHESLRYELAGATNIKVLEHLAVQPEEFVPDGIHLNEGACYKQFVHISGAMLEARTPRTAKRAGTWAEDIEAASASKRPTVHNDVAHDLNSSMSGRGKNYRGRTRGNLTRTGASGNDSSSEMDKWKEAVNGNLKGLNFESVCVWESADVSTNKHNLHVILLDQVPKAKYVEAIDVAKLLAEGAGLEKEAVTAAFFLPGKTDNKSYPKMKVIFTNSSQAYKFRTSGFAKRKQGQQPWKTLYLSNESTKSTRVRVEILKRIADIVKKEATFEKDLELIVNKYEPRPMILLKKDNKILRRITYVDALKRWGGQLSAKDLELAKRIGGKEYDGRFQSVFGV